MPFALGETEGAWRPSRGDRRNRVEAAELDPAGDDDGLDFHGGRIWRTLLDAGERLRGRRGQPRGELREKFVSAGSDGAAPRVSDDRPSGRGVDQLLVRKPPKR